ncbi:MAG: transporter [Pseudomonadales bacterium]
MMNKLLTASITLLFLPAAAMGCDFCLLQQGISPLDSLKGSGLRVSQRYTRVDEVYEGTNHVPNPGAREAFWTTDLSGFFSPRDGWLLLANLPVRATRVRGHLHLHDGDHEDEEADADAHAGSSLAIGGNEYEVHPDRGGDEGIGDLSLLARYNAFEHHTLTHTTLVALTLGVKLPTGSTSGRTNDGEYLDAHTQLGTGSWDVLAGAAINHSFGRWTLSGNALASFNGKGEAGNVDHTFGDSLNYDASVRYRLLPAMQGGDGVSVFASIGVAGEWRGHEKEAGQRVRDSGGHTLYVVPAVQINVGQHWIAELSYRKAVWHDLHQVQLGEDFKLFGSINYLF